MLIYADAVPRISFLAKYIDARKVFSAASNLLFNRKWNGLERPYNGMQGVATTEGMSNATLVDNSEIIYSNVLKGEQARFFMN